MDRETHPQRCSFVHNRKLAMAHCAHFSASPQYHREGDDDNHDDSGGDFNFHVTMETQEPDTAQSGSFLDNDGTLLTGDNLVEQPRKVFKR